MFASSLKESNTSATHTPLQAAQEPALATRSMIAGAVIKQYQVIKYDINTGGCTPAATVDAAMAGTQVHLGVAAMPSTNGGQLSIYTQGNFNVAKLDLSAITAIAGFTEAQIAAYLNKSGIPGLIFSVVGQDDVLHA